MFEVEYAWRLETARRGILRPHLTYTPELGEDWHLLERKERPSRGSNPSLCVFYYFIILFYL